MEDILINILTDNDGFDGYVNDYLKKLEKGNYVNVLSKFEQQDLADIYKDLVNSGQLLNLINVLKILIKVNYIIVINMDICIMKE